MQVLLVNPPDLLQPDGASELLLEIGWKCATAGSFRDAVETARGGGFDAAIVYGPDAERDISGGADFHNFIRLLEAKRIAAVVLSDRPMPEIDDGHSLVEVVRRDIPLAELRGRLSMIERYHGLLQKLELELRNMERLSKRLNEHFHEIDQEMRLAGRLQRDFLPDLRKPIAGLRFASVFRPASWVSGDMFDVFRVDEEHVGVYLADAVGHGMAASLLSMFIKRAIVPKRIENDRHTVLCPSEIMAALNDALTDQALPNCQFVTACYALINTRTLKLRYARGGHPYPLLMTSGGVVSDLKCSGGLLGLFKGEEFAVYETQLEPGDKLLFYTDGVELAFQDEDESFNSEAYQKFFESVSRLPIEQVMKAVDHRLDGEAGSLNPKDDVTILGCQVPPIGSK